jgi:hypothetical protein
MGLSVALLSFFGGAQHCGTVSCALIVACSKIDVSEMKGAVEKSSSSSMVKKLAQGLTRS